MDIFFGSPSDSRYSRASYKAQICRGHQLERCKWPTVSFIKRVGPERFYIDEEFTIFYFY